MCRIEKNPKIWFPVLVLYDLFKSEYLACQINSIYIKEYNIIELFVSSCRTVAVREIWSLSSIRPKHISIWNQIICHWEVLIVQSLAAMAAFTHFHYQFYHILASIIIPRPFYVMFMSFSLANYLIFYPWFVRVSSLASFYPFFICMFVRPTVRPSIRPPCLSTILSPSVSMYTSGSPLSKRCKKCRRRRKGHDLSHSLHTNYTQDRRKEKYNNNSNINNSK